MPYLAEGGLIWPLSIKKTERFCCIHGRLYNKLHRNVSQQIITGVNLKKTDHLVFIHIICN